MHHAKSLWRRLFAVLIDLTLINLVVSLLVFPWANSLSSPLIVSSGLFNLNSCDKGGVYTTDGLPINFRSDENVTICDHVINGVFPSRVAVITREVSRGVSNFVSIPLDDRNRIRSGIEVSSIVILFVPFIAAFFEASRLWATPGKLLLSLKVKAANGSAARLHTVLFRNLLKYLVVTMTIVTLPLTFRPDLFSAESLQRIYFDTSLALRPFDDIWTALAGPGFLQSILFSVMVALVNVILVLSIFWPWGDKGRALYDRWAGTIVVLKPAETTPATPSAPA